MNSDIRLSVGFWEHPKTVKLTRRLGLEGVRSLQILWLWATQNRPDGVLSGMDAEDIEIAAKWTGEPSALYAVLIELRFVDMTTPSDGSEPPVHSLHGWAKHNSWQAEAEARSEAARKAAKARWANAKANDAHIESDAPAMRMQCARNAKANEAQCPSPLLSSPENLNTPPPANTSRVRVDPPTSDVGGEGEVFPEPRDGPKKTDSPSKGNPEWRAFLSCWEVYPVKQGQEDAWREWMRLKQNGTLAQAWEIRDAILRLVGEDSRWLRGKVPKMAKWLSGKGWNDEPFVEPAQGAETDAPQPKVDHEAAKRAFETLTLKARQDAARAAKREP